MGKHVFGPVPSRRLGRSLGVDLVPFKTCTFDCIYCQLGRTTCKTIERREWVPLGEVLDELDRRLDCRPDYVTLGGSGEPTLFSRLDELIDGIKQRTDTPVAVLTNGSLLWQPDLRRQLRRADLVIPSLDAGSAEVFHLVNRPHEALPFERLVEGLEAFRDEFRGGYWLEVFLIAAYTTFDDELGRIREIVGRLRFDRVQLNTVTRPPAEDFAAAVSEDRLRAVAATFSPPAEVIVAHEDAAPTAAASASADEILALLKRRPCSARVAADSLGMHPAEVVKQIEGLVAAGLVESAPMSGELIFRATAFGRVAATFAP
jgi:wyosine [tRNA(Phe)-imidazoG37] synthetase (radical SAM superfamily)